MFTFASFKQQAVGVTLAGILALSASAFAPVATAGTPAHSSGVAGSAAQGAAARIARQTHRFRGTVTFASQGHRWFGMRTTTRHRVRIHVNQGTFWDDCDWGNMGYGHHVDVRAYRSHGLWVASSLHNWHDRGDWGDMWMH